MKQLSLTDYLPFGKYKGAQVEDILYDDPGYMAWMYQEQVVQFDEHVIKNMEDRKLI